MFSNEKDIDITKLARAMARINAIYSESDRIVSSYASPKNIDSSNKPSTNNKNTD